MSIQISADGLASGAERQPGSISAPLLTYRLWMKPSLPTTNSGSTRPKPIGAGPRPRPGAAGGAPRWASGWPSAAAPLPGSPTALPLRTPPRPPPPTIGAAIASAVRRLGIAIRPPGHAIELDGRPPVGAE
jgi:hypothetical protein